MSKSNIKLEKFKKALIALEDIYFLSTILPDITALDI